MVVDLSSHTTSPAASPDYEFVEVNHASFYFQP